MDLFLLFEEAFPIDRSCTLFMVQVSPSEDNVSIHATLFSLAAIELDNRVAPLKGKPRNILSETFFSMTNRR